MSPHTLSARTISMLAVSLLCLLPANAHLRGQPRDFCDSRAEAGCLPVDCKCTDDRFEIAFEGQLENFAFVADDPGRLVRARVLLDAKSDRVQAFSVGVRHDPRFLDLAPGSAGLNLDGGPDQDSPTASAAALNGGFVALRQIDEPVPGFLAAVILHFSEAVVLPVGRITLVNCNYRIVNSLPPDGTRLEFAEDLGEPPVQLLLTVQHLSFPDRVPEGERNCTDSIDNDRDGLIDRVDPDCIVSDFRTHAPEQVVDGLILPPCSDDAIELCDDGIDNDCDGLIDFADPACEAEFRRADANANGRLEIIDVLATLGALFEARLDEFECDDIFDINDDGRLTLGDPIHLFDYLFRRGPALPRPGPACGTDPTLDELRPCGNSNCR